MDAWDSGSLGRADDRRRGLGWVRPTRPTIMDHAMSTRMLVLLAAGCAVVILAASAVQILLAR